MSETLITTFISNAQRANAKYYFEILDPLYYTGMFSAPMTPDGYTVTHWCSSGYMESDWFDLFTDAQALFNALTLADYDGIYLGTFDLTSCQAVVDDIIIFYGSFADANVELNFIPLIEEA